MPTKSPYQESNHTCGHPECCLLEEAATEAAGPYPGEATPEKPETGNNAAKGAFKRWLLWFLAFFGIYASSSMCPFCGTPGCPVGAGGAFLVGGFFAVLLQYGKNFWESFKRMVAKPER
jgi:hypothetical protein